VAEAAGFLTAVGFVVAVAVLFFAVGLAPWATLDIFPTLATITSDQLLSPG
jgi:hypothetical protein